MCHSNVTLWKPSQEIALCRWYKPCNTRIQDLQLIMDCFSAVCDAFWTKDWRRQQWCSHPSTRWALQWTNNTCEKHLTGGCWHFPCILKVLYQGMVYWMLSFFSSIQKENVALMKLSVESGLIEALSLKLKHVY